MDQVFNSRSGRVYVVHSCYYKAKRPNLKLKAHTKHLLGSLPLDIALQVEMSQNCDEIEKQQLKT
jgi:hypothetical protein